MKSCVLPLLTIPWAGAAWAADVSAPTGPGPSTDVVEVRVTVTCKLRRASSDTCTVQVRGAESVVIRPR